MEVSVYRFGSMLAISFVTVIRLPGCYDGHSFAQLLRSRGIRIVSSVVCLFVRPISQKPMQLGSPNLTNKCSTMSPRNSFLLGSKGQESQNNIAGVGICSLVSAGFF